MQAILFICDKEDSAEQAADLSLAFAAAQGDPKQVKQLVVDLQK